MLWKSYIPIRAIKNQQITFFLLCSCSTSFEGWQLVYDNSPRQLYRAFNDSSPALEANILGGEACMWSEQVGGEAIMGKLWPRGAALAERLWSDPPTGGVQANVCRLC